MKFKTAVNFISDFETKIANYARARDCEAVICGHIHKPTVQKIEEITYCNTGDWVEHCTAILEHEDGSWELAKEFSIAEAPKKTQPSRRQEDLPEQPLPQPHAKTKEMATVQG